MGSSGLIRWTNAPTTGLELIAQNIVKNHQGVYKGKWSLSMKSFRSTFTSTSPGYEGPERLMCTLTMDDKVFCVIEDVSAPLRSDYLSAASQAASAGQPYPTPSHFRHTFPTLGPPGALEQLMGQLHARWVPVRQTGASGTTSTGGPAGQKAQQAGGAGGAHLVVDGHVYAIGNDWLVRAGNVIIQPGGAVKGMLVEAEYIPLPVMEESVDVQPVFASLLLSVLPNMPDARIVGMSLADWQWAEVQWDGPEDLEREAEEKKKKAETEDDIYASEGDHPPYKKGDWMGVDRDRRSAYLIIAALKQEGLL